MENPRPSTDSGPEQTFSDLIKKTSHAQSFNYLLFIFHMLVEQLKQLFIYVHVCVCACVEKQEEIQGS